MRVALIYNQKKEDATQQHESNESAEPPSSGGTQALILPTPVKPSINRSTDLYAEWDTADTINAVKYALGELHQVSMIEADEDAYYKLRTDRPDIVFNITEGLYGSSRESQIPAMLEMLQIPYTGSDPLTLAICLDKSRAKEILSYHHIPTPQFSVVSKISELDYVTARFPGIVKPLHEGSSKGIFNSSLVMNEHDLRREVTSVIEHYHEPALIEEFLSGREFTVAMLGNGDGLRVLPIVEIKFDSLPQGVNPIYSYEAKWIWDRSDNPLDIFECPAKLNPHLQHEIETICRKAYTILRCRDWCRIDVRLDADGKPHIIELNPLPGILPNPEDNSCFPKAARAAGVSYSRLIQSVLAYAAKRYHLLERESSFHPTF
jgi:D-alanine-D-alanine ligase